MVTDWLLIRRLGSELDERLRGARIRSVGVDSDGRFALETSAGRLTFDLFGALPAVLLAAGRGSLEASHGWPRAAAAALEGLRVDAVRSRRGDRLLAFECSSRSRFGVTNTYRLVAELVPRFGNLLLLKSGVVVSAAKFFAGDRAGRRTIAAGEPYQPAALPRERAGTAAALPLLAQALLDPAGSRTAAQALRSIVPLLPPEPAESLVLEAAQRLAAGAEAGRTSAALEAASALWERARETILRAEHAADEGEPLFVWRDGESRLLQAHLVPLAQYAAHAEERSAALAPLLAEASLHQGRSRADQARTSRRAALAARLAGARSDLERERAALETALGESAERDALRHAGEALYAHAHEVPPGASRFAPPSSPDSEIALDPNLDAKANAAAYFARYRKAGTRRVHLERRIASSEARLELLADLAWQLDAEGEAVIDDVAAALARLERRKPSAQATAGRGSHSRRIDEIALSGDSRIFVGRSPSANAHLTFRVARPNDLWFHARGTPGAHVVLRIDGSRAPNEDELRAAAAAAAYHSRARASEKVEIDYTARKYVRRRDGAPGLVWYTNARTVLVEPKDAAAS